MVEMEELVNQNPWWMDPARVRSDQLLNEYDASPIKWRPDLLAEFDLADYRVYTMRGPRQVGKTTLLKLMLRERLEGGAPPGSVLYLTADLLASERDLVDAIQRYLEFSSGAPTDVRRLVLIDEVSSVPGWERAVKYLHDTGALTNAVLVLTGSHSLDLRYSAERLPGRRGEGKGTVNKVLRPMSFAEYVATVEPRLSRDIAHHIGQARDRRLGLALSLLEGRVDRTISHDLVLFQRDLRACLDDYLVTGGIARAVREHRTDGNVAPRTYDFYVRALVGDLARWRFQETLARQVLRSVVDKMTTRVSLHSIEAETTAGSHSTISRYLDALVDTFLLHSVHQVGLDDGKVRYKRERKLYFQDPFLYHAVNAWVRGRTDHHGLSLSEVTSKSQRGKLVEMVVCDHLVRMASGLHPSDVLAPQDLLSYWRKKGSDREVDFVLSRPEGLLPVEVKLQPTIRSDDLAPLRAFKRGLLLSGGTLETRGAYAIVPVELFLALV